MFYSNVEKKMSGLVFFNVAALFLSLNINSDFFSVSDDYVLCGLKYQVNGNGNKQYYY